MKFKVISFWFANAILLTSCSQRKYRSSFDCSGILVGKGIPFRDTLSYPTSYRDYTYLFAKQLNIPNINAGDNDSTLRIWLWQNDTVSILNIEKHGSTGTSHLVSFTRIGPPPKSELTITRCSTTNAPRHGWESFFDTLKCDDIPFIPDGKPNYQLDYDLTSGGRIYIEWQQGLHYRFYSYLEPGYFQYVDSNAAKLHRFLIYLQNEFSISVYEDLTRLAEIPIRPGKTISREEYRYMRDNKFIDSGENVLQIYGDFTRYTAILTNKRIGDYFPRAINLGDSVYEYVSIANLRQVNLNFSSRGNDTFRILSRDGSNFTLRLGGSRQQRMDFFDSADLYIRRARILRERITY